MESTTEPRRGFLRAFLTVLIGAVAFVPPTLAGVCAFLNPFRQKSRAGQFMRLASLDTLGETPAKFAIIADRTDAWNRFPDEPIGAVYLRRIAGNRAEAIQVVCPHAGCSVQFDAKSDGYICPCHLAQFTIDGRRVDAGSNESPRDLDTLEVEIRDGNEVWVKFQTFQIGTTKKIAEA